MRALLVLFSFLFILSYSNAQEVTLETRVSELEYKISNLSHYIENNCELILEYGTAGSSHCFNSVMSGLRTTLNRVGDRIYVNNWIECKRYRLICR